MNGLLVGKWSTSASGVQEFIYDENWMSSPLGRPLSLSMPFRPSAEPYRNGVDSFFENLLPDNPHIRERIQRRFKTDSVNAFDLLREIGRDCVGALQLLSEEAPPPSVKHITGHRLDKAHVAERLQSILGDFRGITPDNEEFRISLAGAQEKAGFLWHKSHWYAPTGATPTTHIFKLPIGPALQGIDLSSSVENEWLCAQLLKGFGVPVANSQIDAFGDYKVLIVERFDRRLSQDGTWWMRLPQEDFCQATGISPVKKYESDGGPGIQQIMEILGGSENAVSDRVDFMRRQLIFWVLAAIDGHAKNFSLFLLPQGNYRLTPCYDVISAYPILGHERGCIAPEKIKMAMAVFGKSRHYRWQEFRLHHWMTTAKRCGFGKMETLIDEILEAAPQVVELTANSLPKHFPSNIAEKIFTGIMDSLRVLKQN